MKRTTTSQRIAALQKLGNSEEIRAKIVIAIENADTDYKVDVYLKEQAINYAAQFVPQSASRNAASKDKQINWRVTFTSGAKGAVLSTDYSQGIGHIPGRPQMSRLAWHAKLDSETCESGRYGDYKVYESWQRRSLPAPSAASVIYGLLLDSSVSDSACFEDWAIESGYDIDSRKAEDIYNACKLIARDFNRVFNAAQRAHLQTLLQDY